MTRNTGESLTYFKLHHKSSFTKVMRSLLFTPFQTIIGTLHNKYNFQRNAHNFCANETKEKIYFVVDLNKKYIRSSEAGHYNADSNRYQYLINWINRYIVKKKWFWKFYDCLFYAWAHIQSNCKSNQTENNQLWHSSFVSKNIFKIYKINSWPGY